MIVVYNVIETEINLLELERLEKRSRLPASSENARTSIEAVIKNNEK